MSLFRSYFLPLRGKTESIFQFKNPKSGMLLLSTDEYKMYLYLNEEKGWIALNQNALAYEYTCWGFMIPRRNPGYRPIYLRSYLTNLNNVMSLTLKHGKTEHRLKYSGSNYEVVFDDDLNQLYVFDGVTPGGKLL